MSLLPVIAVDITIDSTGVPRQGFGTPLIPSHAATWPERTRTYGGIADVLADWAEDSPEALCATACFSQENPPESLKIGRVASPVTQRYSLLCTDPVNAHLYRVSVSGKGLVAADATYTADAATSAAEVNAGLVAALNAFPAKTFTAAFAALVVADATFVGEADDDTLTREDALVVADKDFTAANATEIFTAAAHGRATGDGPVQVSNVGGALPTGLLAATDYWFIVIDANTFYLATSVANAIAGTHLSIGDNGTGTQTYADTAETRKLVAHGLLTGDGPVRVATTSALPTGLAAATDYWAIKTGTYTFKLATSLANALAGTAINLTTDGAGVQTLSDTGATVSPSSAFTVTGDAPGSWFSLSVPMADANRLSNSQTHAAGTVTTDLDAILVEDSDWYCLLTLFNSKAYVQAVAAWAEANKRVYAVDFPDTECLTTAFDIEAVSATDLMGALAASAGAYTMYSYHQRPAAFLSAAWMGDWLPTDPGEATAALKTLVGPETTKLTATHFANLEKRRGNAYIFRGGRGITWESKVGSTKYAFLDVTRNVDFLKDGVATTGFGLLAGAKIIPYTPDGVAQLAGAVRGFLTGEATDSGVLSKDPAPNVIPPKFDSIPAQDKKERVLRKLKFSGVLSGAIHAAKIDGTVSF